jgi:hypothetical protein
MLVYSIFWNLTDFKAITLYKVMVELQHYQWFSLSTEYITLVGTLLWYPPLFYSFLTRLVPCHLAKFLFRLRSLNVVLVLIFPFYILSFYLYSKHDTTHLMANGTILLHTSEESITLVYFLSTRLYCFSLVLKPFI